MEHLDIKEGQIEQKPLQKGYFMPFPMSGPIRDPYYTGPMSEPVISPAGGIIMPRRNPYYVKPMNPMLNPYNAQYKSAMWPTVQRIPRTGGTCPHHGIFCPTPTSMNRPPMGPMGTPPMGPPPMGPMGPPPMGPMGPPSVITTPISTMLPPSGFGPMGY